jgi:L-threonylcarbamoyladenylate synthase
MNTFEEDIEKCIEVLKKGGIILYPTDTIWGIGCDATNEHAVEKIFILKKRPESKSLIILVVDEKEILNYVEAPDKKIFEYLSGTDKPTTVIYEHAKHLAKNATNEEGTIAIRIVKDDFCSKLIQDLGKPIVSTSANISGKPFPKNYIEISTEIKNGVDYIVQHRQKDIVACGPSPIIKLNKEGDIERIR